MCQTIVTGLDDSKYIVDRLFPAGNGECIDRKVDDVSSRSHETKVGTDASSVHYRCASMPWTQKPYRLDDPRIHPQSPYPVHLQDRHLNLVVRKEVTRSQGSCIS